ncbi:MAG TPA: hypothetical protein PLL36_11785 [Candidatus Hydrogenedentes bacterium]|jgi:hypothetical protein|nr:hypothetical protein [Candidatus Hydrogenedentota bacterium]
MDALLDELGKVLNDHDAGWVARRDAAEKLGKVAHRALGILLEHKQDPDMDVQMEVGRCLEPLHILLSTRGKRRKPYTLRELALSCEKHGFRTVEAYKTGFVVTVKLDGPRMHRVYLMPGKFRDKSVIRLFTLCGEATSDKLLWALKANTKLFHGAFATLKFNDEKHLAIVNNILKDEASPDVIKRGVKEMAYYGDWLEKKLSDMDAL